ncbi:Myb domain protein 62, partial [Tanacetum coccineum]
EGGGQPPHGLFNRAIDNSFGSLEKIIAKINTEGCEGHQKENSDFDFKCTRMRSAMSSQLGYQHRNHQYKLHIHYKEYETMEEAMTHPPKGIEVSDWVLLCERFASEDFQKISGKNKKNRSKNLVPPTVGTRSLARRVDESRREGKEVSEIE